MDLIVKSYQYETDKKDTLNAENSHLSKILETMIDLFKENNVKAERHWSIMTFITSFDYLITQRFMAYELQNNSLIYQKY